MHDIDDGRSRPRHRKNGRATRRAPRSPGRHLRAAPRADPGSSPLGTYPVENLAAMSASAVELLLHRARIEAATTPTAVPHVLTTRDDQTGAVIRSRTFPSGLEALVWGVGFVDKYRDLEPRWEFTLTVAPLVDER